MLRINPTFEASKAPPNPGHVECEVFVLSGCDTLTQCCRGGEGVGACGLLFVELTAANRARFVRYYITRLAGGGTSLKGRLDVQR